MESKTTPTRFKAGSSPRISRWSFKRLKFRNKLLAAFLIIFVPIILLGNTVLYYQVKALIQGSISRELQNNTNALINMIHTGANISIKNRLLAIAEKNFEIAEYFYSKYRSGLLTREKAIHTIEEIFLNQSIGISGYIYCLNSKGDVIIHPNDRVKGTNVAHFDFVRQQMAIKDGYLEYNWQNPGEPQPRPKALYMVYYKPLDWIITVSSYRNEFSYLVDIGEFKENVRTFRAGHSGYAFIMDENSTFLIHPELQGQRALDLPGQPRQVIQKVLAMKNGRLRYAWRRPGETRNVEKIMIFSHLPEYGWIICSTSYVDEVFAPLRTFTSLLLAGIVFFLFCFAGLTYLIARSVTRPLESLTQTLDAGRKGDYTVRMAYVSQDELGGLADHFNAFMDQLERYHNQLNAEIQKTVEAQAALVENELKLRGLFNQSFQYTCILSPYGILEEINQSTLEFSGCTDADVLYQPYWEAPWWGHDTKTKTQIQAAIEKVLTGTMVRMETTHISASGQIRNIDISIKPIVNNAQDIEFIIAEGRDITDLKQAEEERRHLAVQLEKSQKMEAIGTLAGGIAHDFNNILSSIFGYTQLAEMSLEKPEKVQRHISQIVKGAQRASGLIQQILTFSRQTEYRKQPLKLHLVVKEALKLLRSTIPSTIDIIPDIRSRAMVNADPTQMHQVIMNLCTNAYHAMLESGGTLTVVLEEVETITGAHGNPKGAGPFLMLSVADTGHGMDEKTLKKAFDPYFTTKAPGRGTGFGLALVHAIVDEHNGIVHAQSRPGKGTTFFIYMPVVREMASAARAEKDRLDPSGGNETLMVVDDEADIRDMTRELLESYGYTVHTFENGDAALRAFEANTRQFSLVITDMTMPKMTGAELARALLSLKPGLPVILCTGYTERLTQEKAEEMGISRYLQKPIQNRDLLRVIRNVLDAAETP